MIESTALCLCVSILAFAGRFLVRGVDAAAAVIAGSLGAAKPPTVANFDALAGVWRLSTWRRVGFRLVPAALVRSLIAVLPVADGWVWQQYVDTLKALDANPLTWGVNSQFNRSKATSEATFDRFRKRWGLVESPDYRGRCQLYVRPPMRAPLL